MYCEQFEINCDDVIIIKRKRAGLSLGYKRVGIWSHREHNRSMSRR